MKYLITVSVFIVLQTGALRAQRSDSAAASTKNAIINAGWLQDTRGPSMHWENAGGRRVEVIGRGGLERKIRLFKNHKFEMAIYRMPDGYDANPGSSNEHKPCHTQQGDEMAVMSGRWSVNKDTVYLSFRRRSFYEFEQYAEYLSLSQSGNTSLSLPKVVAKCKMRRKETYFWLHGKMCLVDAMDICFK